MARFYTFFWPIISGILFALSINLWLERQEEKQAPTNRAATSYASAVNRAKSSVASIHTTQIVQRSQAPFNNSSANEQIRSSLGSAVIVDDSGYLLTNHHVINGADQITVTLFDGRHATAKIVGTDEQSDLAVLWIPLQSLSAIAFGSAQAIQVGDVVLAIGNPFGFGHTVTQGIISATGRWGLDPGKYENYLQTDADINVGNSGGALINTNGELLGINSAIFSQSGGSQGIGLAIPSDLAEHIMHELIQQGEVTRGWLGIGVQEINPSIAEQFQLPISHGVLVTGITPNGPAANAGVRVGDIITAIDHLRLDNGRSGMFQVAMFMPGKQIDIELYRDNQKRTVNAIVGKKPDAAHQQLN